MQYQMLCEVSAEPQKKCISSFFLSADESTPADLSTPAATSAMLKDTAAIGGLKTETFGLQIQVFNIVGSSNDQFLANCYSISTCFHFLKLNANIT